MPNAALQAVQFTLLESELKSMKSALTSLHKIGQNLMIEARPSEIHFRTVNSSRSGYMSITCGASFFQEYHVFHCDVLYAVLLFKHIMAIFRSQRIEEATFNLNATQCRLTVVLKCENAVTKTYRFPTLDEQPVRAEVERTSFPVQVTMEPGKIGKLLSTFHNRVAEVRVTAFPEATSAGGGKCLQLRSHLDPTKGHAENALHTLLSVEDIATFASYTNTSDVPVEAIFNVKDFRAMLSICEALHCNLKLYFQGQGHPLLVEASMAAAFGQVSYITAELILSTFPGDEPSQEMPLEPSPPERMLQQAQEQIPEHFAGGHEWNGDDLGDSAIAGTPPEFMEPIPGAVAGMISLTNPR